jgi:Cupin domain
MRTATRFLRRDPADVKPWAETWGQIRPLVEEEDGAPGEVHHVEIEDAKLHYHEHTDEFYYVISGGGTMVLDGEEIELHAGVVVYVPRGGEAQGPREVDRPDRVRPPRRPARRARTGVEGEARLIGSCS